MEMIVCGTLFKKEENELITNESDGIRSTIDCSLVRRADLGVMRNVR